MSEKNKESPNKRAIEIVTRWSKAELEVLTRNADAADLKRAIFIRECALGCVISSRRGLTADTKKLFGIGIAALNEAGAPLSEICEQLRTGDIPLESEIHRALYRVTTALAAFDQVLLELRRIGDEMLAEAEKK